MRDGFILINVDSRGAGQSPGRLDVNSPVEFRDFYDAIEWAAVQPWSTGKVGLLGISYYAASQWFVASMTATRRPTASAFTPASDSELWRNRPAGAASQWLREGGLPDLTGAEQPYHREASHQAPERTEMFRAFDHRGAGLTMKIRF